MTLDDIITAIRELPDEEFNHLADQMFIMRRERDAKPFVQQAEEKMVEQVWEAHPELKPEFAETVPEPAETVDSLIKGIPEWVQPSSPASAYPAAALVAHKGLLYRNQRARNSKEPGVRFSGWEDVTAHFLKPDVIEPEPTGPEQPAPEPEQPAAPAPGVREWRTGELVSKGDTRLHDGKLVVAQRLHTTADTNRPDKGTGHWRTLD